MCMAKLLEQLEILHVARADLDDIDIADENFDVIRRHNLRHNRKPRFGARLFEQLKPIVFQPLECIRRRARFEGAAA